MSNNTVDQTEAWAALEAHKTNISSRPIKDYFSENPKRFENYHLTLEGLLFDFSKHKMSDETLPLLCDLAKTQNLERFRDEMFSGSILNTTEERAVLHAALRGSTDKDLTVDGENVSDFVQDIFAQVQTLSEQIRSDKSITDVINIGIGGSDLGPRMVYKALAAHSDGPHVHFVSNIDGSALEDRLKHCTPESTVLIITSKSFSTLETLTNAKTLKAWFLKGMDESSFSERLYAISTNIEAATNFGVLEEHILPLRDWIGGRFSLWSAVGLSIAVAVGFEKFKDLLAGACTMDQHFQSSPMDQNIPVIMGLIGVWYRNFWGYPSKAILPYAHDLRDLPKYLQQLDMESNGKSVDRNGQPLSIQTGPVIFGEAGTNAQHAFMQLLHQSSEIIPADFIIVKNAEHSYDNHHEKLLANALAQSKALMDGKPSSDAHRVFEGNRPSSTIVLDRLDPYHLGMLIALYEHVVFVQGVIWGINSFDQWGVELGKVLAKSIQNERDASKSDNMDASTQGLLNRLGT